MELHIKPNEADRAALAKAVMDGERVSIIILPGKQKAETSADASPLPDDVRQLVAEWNGSDFIRYEAVDESRNNRITSGEALQHLSTLKRALKEIGMVPLLKTMSGYFEACREGCHLVDGCNRGYSHLAGFVRYALKNPGRKPWWKKAAPEPYEDEHPKLTVKIADAYARKFLRRRAYGLKNPSSVYERFLRAAHWVELKAAGWKMNENKVIRLLMDTVAERYPNSVSPGNLSSEIVWEDYIPQNRSRMTG